MGLPIVTLAFKMNYIVLSTITIPPLDLAIILLYMCGILTIGLLSVSRIRITGAVFFLAGRSLSWPLVGAALFASNISTIHLVGLTASGYNEGLVLGKLRMDGRLPADPAIARLLPILLSNPPGDLAGIPGTALQRRVPVVTRFYGDCRGLVYTYWYEPVRRRSSFPTLFRD
jgi:hypothetical protein